MSPVKLLIGLGLVVLVAFVGTYVGDSGGPNPETPTDVDWDFETEDGEIHLTHRSGPSVPRESLIIRITRDGTEDELVTDLGSSADRWVLDPFGDGTVTRGDTLVVAEPDDHDASIRLVWRGPTHDSTLASYGYSSAGD